MKKMKMSARHTDDREMNKVLQTEMLRDESRRLEQQRIDFEHGARMARTNLYGVVRTDMGRGWVDAKRR